MSSLVIENDELCIRLKEVLSKFINFDGENPIFIEEQRLKNKLKRMLSSNKEQFIIAETLVIEFEKLMKKQEPAETTVGETTAKAVNGIDVKAIVGNVGVGSGSAPAAGGAAAAGGEAAAAEEKEEEKKEESEEESDDDMGFGLFD